MKYLTFFLVKALSNVPKTKTKYSKLVGISTVSENFRQMIIQQVNNNKNNSIRTKIPSEKPEGVLHISMYDHLLWICFRSKKPNCFHAVLWLF